MVSNFDGGPVLSGNRIAFQAGSFVYFLNKDGTNPQRVGSAGASSYPSALVADRDGNVYFLTQGGITSLDASGRMRWQGGGSAAAAGEYSYYAPPVLGLDGVVYAVASDQRLYALRTDNGDTIWSRPLQSGQYSSRVMGGGGSAVFVAIAGSQTAAFDKGTGGLLGSFIDPADGKSFTWDWGSWTQGWEFGITDGRLLAFDVCGRSRWPDRFPYGSGVITTGEAMVTASDGALQLFDADGKVVVGPSPAEEGRAMAAGGDGTIYTIRCEGSGINRILAYGADLQKLWSIELGGQFCQGMTGNAVLDDDGVMYIMRSSPNIYGTQVLAIQTRSPGLADSSWPSWRHDNRGTAWLAPGLDNGGLSQDAAP